MNANPNAYPAWYNPFPLEYVASLIQTRVSDARLPFEMDQYTQEIDDHTRSAGRVMNAEPEEWEKEVVANAVAAQTQTAHSRPVTPPPDVPLTEAITPSSPSAAPEQESRDPDARESPAEAPPPPDEHSGDAQQPRS